ncbi:MAG: alpha/beta fold hydrolase [Akkermansiaceae bacterium]
MKIEEVALRFQGFQLHRLILSPDDSARGTLIFFHGQGDFIDRYPPIIEAFVAEGWKCILTDLPGHGQSEGARGHVPGFPFVDAMVNAIPIAGKVAIAGHSMGGLLALREFLKKPDLYRFGWFSSPLLHPAHQASPLMKTILPVVAGVFPWITRSTGVRAEDCTQGERNDQAEAKTLYHAKISLGWARDLFEAAKILETQWLNLSTEAPVLFTQGSADPVCPAPFLRSQLGKQEAPNLHYHEIKDALHEPFTGATAEEFQSILRKEIRQHLLIT